MALTKIRKWGKNLAIRFPREIASGTGLSTSERVELENQDGEIVVRRTTPHFTLRELFAGKPQSSGGPRIAAHSTGDRT